MNQGTVAESSRQAAAFDEDTVMHEGSASEEEQQMADALLSSTPNTPFLELPEVPRRSSKCILCQSSEDSMQPEKRRKALALLAETRAAKSLKLADPNKATFSSETAAEDRFSISSGNLFATLLLLFLFLRISGKELLITTSFHTLSIQICKVYLLLLLVA